MLRINNRLVLNTVLLVLTTLVIFYIIFKKVDFVGLKEVFSRANSVYFLISILLIIPIVLLEIARWNILLKSIKCNLPFFECLSICMAAAPFSLFFPLKTNDFFRSIYLKDKLPLTKSAGTIIAERFLDVWILIFFSLIGLLILNNLKLFPFVLLAFVVLCSLLIFVELINRVHCKHKYLGYLKNLASPLRHLLRNPRLLFSTFALTTIVWAITFLQFFFFLKTLAICIPFFLILACVPIAIFVGMLPITIGGMGTRDSAIMVLFSGYATSTELLGVGLIFAFVRIWLVSLSGLPFLAYFYYTQKQQSR